MRAPVLAERRVKYAGWSSVTASAWPHGARNIVGGPPPPQSNQAPSSPAPGRPRVQLLLGGGLPAAVGLLGAQRPLLRLASWGVAHSAAATRRGVQPAPALPAAALPALLPPAASGTLQQSRAAARLGAARATEACGLQLSCRRRTCWASPA
jgi:hypothetical protein